MEKALTSFILFSLAMGILIPPLGYLSAFGTLILFIVSDKTNELGISIVKNKSFFLLIVSVLLSGLFSNVFAASLVFLILITLQVAHYSMVIYYLKNKGIKNLFNVLDYMAIITSVFGIFQVLTGKLEVNRHWVGYSQSVSSLSRVYSTLYNPNIFAAYLVINICFIFSWLLYVGREPLKQASLILCSLCLMLTYSRGAFVSLIFALIIIYVLKRDSRILFYGAIMLILFILFNNGIGYERINIAKINKDSSSIYRLEIWHASFQMFLQNPIVGNGPGTSWYSLSNVSSKLWGVIYHAHNIFLHFAAETGVLGLLAFINMLICLCFNSLKAIKNACDGLERFVALGAIGSSAAIIVHGLIDAVIVVPTLTLILMNYYALCSFVLDRKI